MWDTLLQNQILLVFTWQIIQDQMGKCFFIRHIYQNISFETKAFLLHRPTPENRNSSYIDVKSDVLCSILTESNNRFRNYESGCFTVLLAKVYDSCLFLCYCENLGSSFSKLISASSDPKYKIQICSNHKNK